MEYLQLQAIFISYKEGLAVIISYLYSYWVVHLCTCSKAPAGVMCSSLCIALEPPRVQNPFRWLPIMWLAIWKLILFETVNSIFQYTFVLLTKCQQIKFHLTVSTTSKLFCWLCVIEVSENYILIQHNDQYLVLLP